LQEERILFDVPSEGPHLDQLKGPKSYGQLARKAARGAAALGIRQVLTYGVNILGGVVLARMLSPSEFGFYAIVSLLLAFLNIFGGTGFAADLIRVSDEPTLQAYRAVFTAQQMIVGAACVVVWVAAPQISTLYNQHHNGALFFRLTAVSLMLTSLMVIPQVRMERQLAFEKLALIEVCQAVSFNAVAILLAWHGYGILAFAIGLVTRSAVGAILANIISPWAVGFHLNHRGLKSHVAFGITLQGGQVLAMVKDSINPLFVGMFLGAAQMGYATWAMTFASYPALLLVPVQRLYLPFFARLQDDPRGLSLFVPRALWIANVILAPLTIFSVVVARPITSIIFGEKWLVALPLFYCLSAVNLSASSSTVLLGLLNALGKPRLSLRVIFLAMVVTWLLGVPLIIYFGLIGFGLAVFGSSLVNIYLFWLVWKETGVSPLRSYWPAWPLSLLMGALILIAQRVAPIHTIPTLLIYSIAAFVTYSAALWYGFSVETQSWIRLLRSIRS
jgi:O-antigen/teichoic acid export membrane protein